MLRDPATVARTVLAAGLDPPSAEELTALARAYLDAFRELSAQGGNDAFRELSAQGGNKVTIRIDAHRYAAAEALAKAHRRTLPQLVGEAIDLAIARGSTR
jgi:predicted HicB family RNase H-like nuclease